MRTPAPSDAAHAAQGTKRVAVMGAGAVGSYFGGMLARAGVPVTMIGRPAFVEAVRRDKLFLDAIPFHEHVAVEASTDVSAVRDANVVLFCVKMTDREEVARAMAPHLAPDAIVVSMQNGVDNAERIRAASGIDVLPAVVYVSAEMVGAGHVKHTALGRLVVGELPGHRTGTDWQPPRTEQITALFVSADVPCRISEDITADLWSKFIGNCGGNAVSAIAQCSYQAAANNPASRALMTRIAEEVIAVARACGVRPPDANFVEKWMGSLEKFRDAVSSTAQDLARGRRTEIESLNGYVVRRGAELGVATPHNFAVYAMVKLLEEKIAGHPQARPASSSQ
ncbi:MAG: ketopantoate reductase family protein [Candidatus Acidiferrales bacterium]